MNYALLRTDDAVEFHVSRSKLIVYLAATVTITACGLIPILKPMPTSRGIIGATILMIIFGLISGYLLMQLLRSSQPALIVTSKGFSYPKAAAQAVSWNAVRDVKPLSTSRGESLLVSLYPEAAEHVTPKGLFAWLRQRSARRRACLVIPLRLIEDKSSLIPQIFFRQVNASRVSRGLYPDLEPEKAQKQLRAELAASACFPAFTLALLVLLAGIFVWEVKSAVNTLRGIASLSPEMLAADGGLLGSAVKESGQWWRLFTAPLLHGDLQHLLSNGISLLVVGLMLERLIGHARFAAIFAFSALSGSVLGLLVNPPNVVGIGASGGIVGLLAAVFVVSFRVATESARKKIKWRAFCTLVFVFLPASSASGIRIDYAAHLGGLIGGVAITSMMLRSWPQDRTNRRTAYPMAALAAAFFAIAAFSVIPIFQQHRFFPLYQELTPDWPSDFIEAKRRSLAAIAEHPRDPRPHFAHAAVLAEAKDLDGAEREMRVILADQDMLALPRFQVLDRNVRYLLSRLLLDTHRHDEAREIASPLCGVTLRPEMQQHFERVALCEPKA